MPKIKPLRRDLLLFLKKHSLLKKYQKQAKLFENDFRHPSLNTELLLPKHRKIYSFRVDKKYRAIFIMLTSSEVEIVDINSHYED